eukprot:scaffold10647_cov113-Isochrysis_galbana.AAC.4
MVTYARCRLHARSRSSCKSCCCAMVPRSSSCSRCMRVSQSSLLCARASVSGMGAHSSRARSLAISSRSATIEPCDSSLTTARLGIILARWAKRSVPSVSAQHRSSAETLATMHVLALPPSESLSRKVSFDSRKGGFV